MQRDRALLKQFTPLGAWALALGCIVGWGAFIMPGTTFLPQAGPLGTAIALGLAALVMMLIALNFHFMMNRYPSAGGAFVYATETFGRQHGFACAWLLALAYLVPIPLNATALALISRNLMGGMLEVGYAYNVAGYDIYLGEIAAIVVLLAVFALVVMANGKLLRGLLAGLAVALVAGAAILGAGAAASPLTSWESLQPAFSPHTAPLVGILAIVATSPWAFVGFDAISQVTPEMRFDLRKAAPIMMLAIAMGALLYITLDTVAASVVPEGYAGWSSYVAATPQLSGLASMPLFYAVNALMGPVGMAVLNVATLCAALTGILGFFMASSRILYAMASRGVLPKWFAKLDSRHHAPANAILVIMFVAITASLFGRTILGWVIDMLSVSTAVGFLYTSAAVWRVAGRENLRAWKAAGIAGTLFSLAFLVLLMVPNPLLGVALPQESYVFLLAWAVLGLNFYVPDHESRVTQLPGAEDSLIES